MTFIIAITAFIASLLTLYSGFGLSTLLMPVIAIFFPVAIAVALTAVIHLFNNLFKLIVVWRNISWSTILRFGIPAILATIPGAWLLTSLAHLPTLHSFHIADKAFFITPIKLTVGLLLILFATLEWIPFLKKITRTEKYLPLGGVLSGFFGGLSGFQGAFRSAFLIHAGLNKYQFIASNAAIAVLVDITRLSIYGINLSVITGSVDATLIVITTLAAFAGVLVGKFALEKVTIGYIQKLVVGMLYLLGVLLIFGVI